MNENVKWLREAYEQAMAKARECQAELARLQQSEDYEARRVQLTARVARLRAERDGWMAQAKPFSDALCDAAKLRWACIAHIDENGRLVPAQGGDQ